VIGFEGRGAQADVLDAFGRRQPRAVRAMYRRYGRLTYAVAYHVLARQDLAEAAVRRTFIDASRWAGGISGESDPVPWMAELAYRTAMAIRRGGAPRD